MTVLTPAIVNAAWAAATHPVASITTEPRWNAGSVHEALLRWGRVRAQWEDGKAGFSGASPYLGDGLPDGQSYDPAEFTPQDYDQVERAILYLEPRLLVILLCYYKPGHLPAAARGRNRSGGRRCASVRVIGGYLGVSKDEVHRRLVAAREAVLARLLTAG